MNNEIKINLLRNRYDLIMKRGFHNSKIGNKILRRIRQLEKGDKKCGPEF